ncbi:uncharacterized protein LOC132938849 [Metopolophium dirhodum]|uniref:uncharacterized protein LOC132938849 n=1 Tax=Metopolophium dirhodum TaxID=44670 RepID=UPI00298F8D11|nr:uncharacterized protein LOC132938849 [Metopolophium dirhodum]
MAMTTIITTGKSKRLNVNGFEGKREKTKSLIKMIGHNDRSVEAATVKSTSPKDINSRAGDKDQPAVIGRSSSTSCGTRRSLATITRVGDQTADPNQITTPFVPFTPRTRTQPRLTSTGSKCTTNKWICDEDVEDEPATEESNGIGTVWQDVTLPTRLPKYPTPIDPVTKLFLKMTSNDRWRRRPADKCTKPY